MQYINKPKITRKKSHKIHSLHITNFTIQQRCLRHFMFIRQTTYFLTLFATLTKFIDIFKHCFPVKSTIQNFHSCSFRSKMSTRYAFMTLSKNVMNFIVRHTSFNNLIWSYFLKIRFIPYVILIVVFYFISSCFTYIIQKYTNYKKINNISKPRFIIL